MELSDFLRANPTTTVEEIAAALGVSGRTVRRDLATLRERGLPIDGEAGPGGGIRLASERGVTAVHLSVAEIVTLWVSARLSQATSDLPWGHAAGTALTKLLASLPAARARELRAFCRRVIVGAPPTSRMVASVGRSSPELLSMFERAFTARIGLGFEYVDQSGRASERRVEPHGLLVQSPLWYVLAQDLDKAEPRMFRMDRMTRVHVLNDVSFRPSSQVIWRLLPAENEWKPLLGSRSG